MPGSLLPWVFPQFFDTDGVPLVGGKLASFLAGTSTPTPAYTDADLTVPHTNPIILNAAGRPGNVFLAELSYKFTLHDANDVLIATVDGIQAVPASGLAVLSDVFSFGGDSTSPVTLLAYPAGATIDKTHAGTSVFRADSGDLPAGTYILEGMLLAGGGGMITVALVNLTDASDLPIVEMASASTTGQRQVSTAIAFAVAGVAKDYALKVKVNVGSGFAWGLKLRRVA